jgi:hypothetical protein
MEIDSYEHLANTSNTRSCPQFQFMLFNKNHISKSCRVLEFSILRIFKYMFQFFLNNLFSFVNIYYFIVNLGSFKNLKYFKKN